MSESVSALEARLDAIPAGAARAQDRVEALVELAWEIRLTDIPRANRLATEARELSIGLGFTLGQARAARVLAMTSPSAETLRDVLAFAHEAKDLFDQTTDRAGSAASRDLLAGIYEYLGEVPLAMELALEALSIAREIDAPIRQAFALCNVGSLHAATGQGDLGIEKLLEALSLFEAAEHSMGIARVSSLLSRACRERGYLEDSLTHARRARDVAARSGSADDLATSLAALAALEQEQGRYPEAEQLFRQALASFSGETGRAVVGLPLRVQLGRLLARRGALEEAESELREGLAAVQRFGALSAKEEANALSALADITEQRGDLAGAVQLLRKVLLLGERVAQNDARTRLAQVEARSALKAAQQEAEIHRLRFVELTQMQAKLVEAEKLAQLGALAAGTAHELNTPLGVLRSNLDLYAKVAERLSELAKFDTGLVPVDPWVLQVQKLSAAMTACKQTSEAALARLGEVSERFRRFTNLDLSEQRLFAVSEGLESALALLAPGVPAGVTIERAFAPAPLVFGWPAALNLAFLTVLQNAVESIQGDGSVRVESTTGADGSAVVRISDTGRGLTEPERAGLFDVGWSATGARTKMRLGLSAAYSTVQRHGGTLQVESQLGHGTTFVFALPAGERPTGTQQTTGSE